MKKLLLVLAAALSFSVHAQNQAAYDRTADMVGAQVKAKMLKRSEGNTLMAQAARDHASTDPYLANQWEYLALMASKAERGEITEEQYVAAVDQSWARYQADISAYAASYNARAKQQNQNAAIGAVLIGAGNNMKQNYPTPVNCDTTESPGVVRTTCR